MYDHREDSVALTDIFLNFKASCLNMARDIRDFAAVHSNLNINEREHEILQWMTEILEEQYGFFEDA